MTEKTLNNIDNLKNQLEEEKLKKELNIIRLENIRIENEIEPISVKAHKAYCYLQQEIEQSTKTKQVYFASQDKKFITDYKHTTLDKILDEISDVLKKYQLFIKETQHPVVIDNKPIFLRYKVELYYLDYKINECEDIIDYITIHDRFNKVDSMAGAKDMAAIITYKRRYLIKSLLNIAEKDDDTVDSKKDNKEGNSKIYVNQMTYQEIITKIDNAKSRDDLIIPDDHLTENERLEISKQKQLKASELFSNQVKSMTEKELKNELLKAKKQYKINIIKNRLIEIENQK
jgi:hypothetical protein